MSARPSLRQRLARWFHKHSWEWQGTSEYTTHRFHRYKCKTCPETKEVYREKDARELLGDLLRLKKGGT